MNTIKKNISPLRKSGNNTIINFQNDHSEKQIKLTKLIEETMLEFNKKYNSITESLNKLREDLIKKMLNIQELSIDESNSSLKSEFLLKENNNNNNNNNSNNKSPNNTFNSISTRNFLKQNFINISRNESRLKKRNQNVKSMNFEEKNIHINNLCNNKNSKNNKLIRNNNINNKNKIFRPIKPHLIYNSNNINKKEKEKKSTSKIQKNVSFKSKTTINNNGFNNRRLNSSFQKKMRLNSEDLNLEKSLIKENKVTEILNTSPIENKNINLTYTSFPTQENDKSINLKEKPILDKSESENSVSESEDNSNNNIPTLKKEIFPSQTTQIGINFLTKEKEEEIYNDNNDEAKKICELIYIILNIQNLFDGKNNVKSLFKVLFDNNKVDSIKDLFFKVIYQKVYVSNSVDKGIFKAFKKMISKNLKELKLICRATNEPLSWLAMNILEIDRYFQLSNK